MSEGLIEETIKYIELHKKFPKEVPDFIRKMVNFDVKKRPDIKQVLKFFIEINSK